MLYHRVEVFVANEPGCEGTHVASAADFADGHVLATLLNKVRFYLPPPVRDTLQPGTHSLPLLCQIDPEYIEPKLSPRDFEPKQRSATLGKLAGALEGAFRAS